MFEFFKRQKPIAEERKINLGGLLYNSLSDYSNSRALNVAAFYCGVNQISNSIATLPKSVVKMTNGDYIKVNHNLNKILNVKPNEKYNSFNLWKSIAQHVIVNGSAYLYIERDANLNVTKITPIENGYVTPLLQPDGTVIYNVAGIGAVESVNMLDFSMHRDRQFRGIPILTYAYDTLKSTSDTDAASNRFFRGGSGLNGVLKSTSKLDNAQKMQIREAWTRAFSNEGNGIAVLEGNIDFQPVSISPKDAMLLEAKEFNVIEIARFLNISPIKLYDLSEVSYSSMEATNISYVTDTIRPFAEMFAHEMNIKLFKPSEIGKYSIEFDYESLLKTDKKSEVEYYRGLLTNGLATPNEIRAKLGFPPISAEDGGDSLMMQISYGSLSDIVQGKYIKQTSQEQNQKVDNQVVGKEEEQQAEK